MRTVADSPARFKPPSEKSGLPQSGRDRNTTPYGPDSSDDAGWAMLPHRIASDLRLSAVDIRVVVALLYFARSKSACSPCDKSIGERCGGISPGTVQRSLRRLERAGYIERRSVAPSDANRTGRILRLLWAGGASPVSEGPAVSERTPATARPTPQAVAVEKAEVVHGENVTDASVRPLEEELRRLPGAAGAQVPRVAQRLAHALNDLGSVGYFVTILATVASGSASVERLIAAFRAGMQAVGRAERPGSKFVIAWKNWTEPPRPSAVNRPIFHRVTPVLPDPVPSDPAAIEAEAAELRAWLTNPRHPFKGYATRRLLELGASPE